MTQVAQQDLERLKGDVRRVGQKIEEREEEITAAIEARKSDEFIADIKKSRDRLVDEEKDVWKQLSDRRAQLVRLASNRLTLRQVIAFPVPELLISRTSPGRSTTETRAMLSRTFDDILDWPEFVPGARELFNNVDNTEKMYHAPKIISLTTDAYQSVRPVADRVDVKGLVSTLLWSVNEVAELLGIPTQCVGGGGCRSASFTDLIVRRTGGITDPNRSSMLVIGVGEVKGDWQFSLERGETLQGALHDPNRIGAILEAVQQVYGDAVIDEAPLLVLTNYHVTVFLKRDAHVQNKTLMASPPIWWDSTDPPLRAAWLYFLQQADALHDMKKMLSRFLVPPTGYVHVIKTTPQQATADAGLSAQDQSSERASVRRHNMPVLRLMAGGEKGTGSAQETVAASTGDTAGSKKGMSNRSSSGVSASIGIDVDDVWTLEQLGVTDEIVKTGLYGYVLKGCYKSDPVAVKLYDFEKRGASAAFESERLAYATLLELQGHAIPRFIGAGRLIHVDMPFIATICCGAALSKGEPIPKHMHRAMRRAVSALHDAGVAHGDLRRSNIIWDGNDIRLVGLSSAVLKASKEQLKSEKAELRAILGS